MRDRRSYFTCFPSVVCVGRRTTVSIVPRDNSRRFHAEKEYEVCIFGIEEDQISYHPPLVYDYPYEIREGCLCFTKAFEEEQEYEIRFHEKGVKKDEVIPLYAVEEDLHALRPLKGDFHAHTYYSDGKDGITMTPADYREEGFDFCTVTDHNRRYTSVLASELYDGVKLGMTILPGEELHTPGTSLHIVHVGGTGSVADRYVNHNEEFLSETESLEKRLSEIPEPYRRRFALAAWTCGKIRDMEGLSILAHPFWKPRKYNVNKEFGDLLFDARLFDALELFGGIPDLNCNLQLGLWQQQLVKGNFIPVVASSDSHDHNATVEYFARRFTLVFAKDNTASSITDAVRRGRCVAGFLPRGDAATGIVPYSEGSVQFYSTDFRLVKLAHFLYRSYFAETRRICLTEGVLMRRYAEGEEVGELLSSLGDSVENFYRRYYGFAPAPTVSGRVADFLDKALEQQRKGPTTKGTSIVGNSRRE
ncbi:MAG: hypothetical protein J6B86_05765 [Clostridia bacterium]|nr:hypothetical protein [Clostridia bacterium]